MVILTAVLLVPLLLVSQVYSIAYSPNGTRMVVVEGFKKVHTFTNYKHGRLDFFTLEALLGNV